MQEDFLGGVVEGFYGQPWTHEQRIELINQMPAWGLNTYFYAPKDDLKHRAIWRTSYSDSELKSLREIIKTCERNRIHFIYGLSPGLDIRFSDPVELQTIRERLEQMINVGGKNFALLFDDLPGKLNSTDVDSFDSIAAAQCDVTNKSFDWLSEHVDEARLLFCPTPYCDRMDRLQLGGAKYLETIGQELVSHIDVLWTGPEIISETIPVESIKALTARIKRPPIIWDNLHANDYDMRRLYCGPYSGRSKELLNLVRGIVSNPNNEFPINFVPLRTLGMYLTDEEYEPSEAYRSAVSEWAEKYSTVRSKISTEDLKLLADCYYLPFEEGEEAKRLYQVATGLLNSPVQYWNDDFEEFKSLHRRILDMFAALTELDDRELFYAWSRRVWELKEELDLINDFVDQKKEGIAKSSGIESETHLPKIYRGGTVAKLQDRLKMDKLGRFTAVAADDFK